MDNIETLKLVVCDVLVQHVEVRETLQTLEDYFVNCDESILTEIAIFCRVQKNTLVKRLITKARRQRELRMILGIAWENALGNVEMPNPRRIYTPAEIEAKRREALRRRSERSLRSFEAEQ